MYSLVPIKYPMFKILLPFFLLVLFGFDSKAQCANDEPDCCACIAEKYTQDLRDGDPIQAACFYWGECNTDGRCAGIGCAPGTTSCDDPEDCLYAVPLNNKWALRSLVLLASCFVFFRFRVKPF